MKRPKPEAIADEEWLALLNHYARRMRLIRAMRAGRAEQVYVWRNGYTVKEHKVRGHYMVRIVAKDKK